jgi:glyoxylase-like metal-dependent hydrolase (beta-lactamase superfamily II)
VRSLGVHVINAGVGESIVIECPDGQWGVIDCYARSTTDPDTNPTVRFLRERAVNRLEFVCLTHPHADHYRGLRQLLELFTVRQFWRFGAFSQADLRLLQKYYELWADGEGDPGERSNASELRELWREVHVRFLDARIPRMVELSGRQTVYPTPYDEAAAFKIITIAPTGTRSQERMQHR